MSFNLRRLATIAKTTYPKQVVTLRMYPKSRHDLFLAECKGDCLPDEDYHVHVKADGFHPLAERIAGGFLIGYMIGLVGLIGYIGVKSGRI